MNVALGIKIIWRMIAGKESWWKKNSSFKIYEPPKNKFVVRKYPNKTVYTSMENCEENNTNNQQIHLKNTRKWQKCQDMGW